MIKGIGVNPDTSEIRDPTPKKNKNPSKHKNTSHSKSPQNWAGESAITGNIVCNKLHNAQYHQLNQGKGVSAKNIIVQ